MTIRIDDPPPQDDNTERQLSRGMKLALIFAGMFVLVCALAVTALLTVRTREPEAGQQPSATSASSTGAGLPRSQTVYANGGDARGTVGPALTNYPHTADGAANAAISYMDATCGSDYMIDGVRHDVEDYIYSKKLYPQRRADDKKIAAARKRLGIAPDGTATDSSKRVYGRCYQEYGAFKVLSSAPDAVSVQIWGPAVAGVGTHLADLSVVWRLQQFEMVWENEDWRIDGPETYDLDPPVPADDRTIWTSFAERAGLLGPGWQVVANAAEQPLADLDLPKE